MKNKKDLRLYCFSPPVMLATLLIEFTFAVFVVWKYKMTQITRLVVAILVFLGIFQGAEFAVCGGLGFDGNLASKLGYGAITLLPPLGIHLAYAIAGKKAGLVVGASYLAAGAFLAYFIGVTGAINGHSCYANYAIFDTNRASSQLYALYYYGLLATAVVTMLRFALNADIHRRNALYALMFGYVAFILPTTVINIIDPSTIAAVPSIMCGFAVLLAFMLVGKVAPESIALKSSPHRLRLKLPF